MDVRRLARLTDGRIVAGSSPHGNIYAFPFDGSSLATVLHGAAPVSVPVKTRMIDWWGPVLVEYWGGSEGGVVTLVGSEDWLEHPGTVGRATPSHEVFAADAEGTRLPAGEIGRAQSRCLHHHRTIDRTAFAL